MYVEYTFYIMMGFVVILAITSIFLDYLEIVKNRYNKKKKRKKND